MAREAARRTPWAGLAGLAALAALIVGGWAWLHGEWPQAEETPPGLIITLRHGADGTAEQLDIEEALVGFLAAEMPASFEPAALEAQAVAARSYVYQKFLAEGEVCDDSAHCLAWLDEDARRQRWGRHFAEYEAKLRAAAESTRGLILLSEGEPVAAYFHAVCGGMTESAADCWGGEEVYPAAACYWDGGRLSASFWPRGELAARLGLGEAELALLHITASTPSGRVREVACADKSWSGSEFRQLLGLASSNFGWLSTAEGYWFTVLGYGHGVGLCQQGAGGLAGLGCDWRQILAVYYAGCDVGDMADLAAEGV